MLRRHAEREVAPAALPRGSRRPHGEGRARAAARLRRRGAEKTGGRKRHIAADTAGRLSPAHLTPADISDNAGAQAVLDALHRKWPWLKRLFADSACDRRRLMDQAAFPDLTLDIVKRTGPAFVVLPRRWAVERTLGRVTRHRRLVGDDEARVTVSDAMTDVARGGLTTRRITHS